MTTYKPIDGREKAIQIAIGLGISFIFAAGFSLLAPWIFTWIAGFFNPTPEALRDCQYKDYLEKTLSELQTCWDQSDSYEAKVRRLRNAIPWFWMLFIFFGWLFLKNPLKGRIRDDSDDIVYDGENVWEIIFHFLIIPPLFYVGIWTFLARDKLSFTALAIVIAAIIIWHVLDKFFREKYGEPKSERAKKKLDS